MKTKRLILTFIGIALLFVFLSDKAYAIPTALGDVPTEPKELSQWILDNSVKIVGGVGILLLLHGGFTILTSEGDPHKLQEGTDIIFSAIAGLLVILFSAILLHIIGYNVLKIF